MNYISNISGLLSIYCWAFLISLSQTAQVYASDDLITDMLFSKNAFWYTPIPSNAPLNEKTADYVQDFLRQKAKYYGTVTINTTYYSSPVYYVADNVPLQTVEEWDCQNKGFKNSKLAAQWVGVPIPEYAIPADGTDSEMSVYQASTDTLWEFWKAKKENGKWKACWGGRMQNASQNPGYFPNHYGTTATSLPFVGGQITAEELQRGEIKHAIGISLVEAEHHNIISWPATRGDGYNPQHLPNRIPQGLRFRLDPAVNVDALIMHPAGKVIAKAAQKYGFVFWDKAGAISLRAQNPRSYTAKGEVNPYNDIFKGAPMWSILMGFPWDRLQFMPLNYGMPE